MQTKSHVRMSLSRCATNGVAAGAATLLLTSMTWARAEVASAQVREGQDLGGGQLVSSINNPGVNHLTGWAFQVNTTNGVTTLSHFFGSMVFGPGSILRTEGTFGNYTQTAFESFWGMSNAGEIAYSPTSNDTIGGFTGLDGVWVDDNAIAVERQTYGNLFWSFGSRPGITADGNIYWCGGTAATVGGATSNRGLFFGSSATPILMGGDLVPNLPRALTTSAMDFDYRFSANGTNYIHTGQMVSPTADDNVMILSGQGLIAGGTLVQESQIIPGSIGGVGGEAWQNFDFLGVTEAGDYLITGDTNAAATADEFIFVNGQMIYRDGSIIDGVTVQGDIEAAYMNENADFAYIWDIAGGTLEALFVNDRLLLTEGDTVDWDGDGLLDAGFTLTDFTGITALSLSDRDLNGMVSVFFTADISTPGGVLEGGFRIDVQIPGPSALALFGLVAALSRRRTRE